MGALRQISGGSIADLKAKLRKMPTSVAHAVAQQAAPLLTRLAQEAFDGGRNVYGDARPTGKDGKPLTLVAGGDTRAALRFVANGTVIRCQLGPSYARYLVGKYGILPNGDRAAMPVLWSRALDELVRTVRVDPERVAA